MLILIAALAALAAAPGDVAQLAHFDRLPSDVLESRAPTDRVRGLPGELVLQPHECPDLPLDLVRRRIVDLAVQEWGFFGFQVRDETLAPLPVRRGAWRVAPEEALRVAPSIAGYWAVTPQAPMMLARQNGTWRGAGVTGRGDPWSAAFVSWIMCEAGLAEPARFQRAIAHHVYIDQAIRARDGAAPQAAFVAYDAGDAAIVPGDLLCAGRRPAYRSIAERRRQMGVGARSHCDIVVKVDETASRILAIGGNVRRAVSLKVLPAMHGSSGHLQPVVLDEGRPVFAHLQMRGEPVEADALDRSPTIRALACGAGVRLPAGAQALISAGGARDGC